jgi:hypothetical protein
MKLNEEIIERDYWADGYRQWNSDDVYELMMILVHLDRNFEVYHLMSVELEEMKFDVVHRYSNAILEK